jgi:hypothetical protein
MTTTNASTMTQQEVAAVLDLEHHLTRTTGDVRDLLSLTARVAGQGKGTERVYAALLALDRARAGLADLFQLAGDLDRESKGEPPF